MRKRGDKTMERRSDEGAANNCAHRNDVSVEDPPTSTLLCGSFSAKVGFS